MFFQKALTDNDWIKIKNIIGYCVEEKCESIINMYDFINNQTFKQGAKLEKSVDEQAKKIIKSRFDKYLKNLHLEEIILKNKE